MSDSKRQADLPLPSCLKDLNAYMCNYQGPTSVRRLKFIASRVPAVRLPAYRLALQRLKQMGDTKGYVDTVQQACELVGGGLGTEWLDTTWTEARKRMQVDAHNKLETALKDSKRANDPEQIRTALLQLAAHYRSIGDYGKSISVLMESMEIGTTAINQMQTAMEILETSVDWGTLGHVQSQANRIRNSRDLKSNPVWFARLTVATALHQLKMSSFVAAATTCLGMESHTADKVKEWLSASDIGQYGCVLALATMGRHELKARVLDSANFKYFLQKVPVWEEIVKGFVLGDYGNCFKLLQSMKNDLLIDVYIHPHVDALYKSIMEKAFTQYFKPFSAVQLPRMATAFHMELGALETMLVALIADNRIQARIDSHNKVLYARHTDQRNASYEKAISIGNVFCRDIKSLLLRTSLLQNNFMIRKPIKTQAQQSQFSERQQLEDPDY